MKLNQGCYIACSRVALSVVANIKQVSIGLIILFVSEFHFAAVYPIMKFIPIVYIPSSKLCNSYIQEIYLFIHIIIIVVVIVVVIIILILLLASERDTLRSVQSRIAIYVS